MNLKSVVIFALFCVSFLPMLTHADTFAQKCPDIQACANSVGALLGQKYLLDHDLRASMNATPNLEFTKENAELLFTTMLNAEGLTRVPLPTEAHLYQIMRQRDARDSAIPIYSGDQTSAPDLPNTFDLITFKYKASHPEALEYIARNARSFMPANARIIPDELSGVLLVSDNAINIKKLYTLIHEMDRSPTPEMKARWTAEKAERAQYARDTARESKKTEHTDTGGVPQKSVKSTPPSSMSLKQH